MGRLEPITSMRTVLAPSDLAMTTSIRRRPRREDPCGMATEEGPREQNLVCRGLSLSAGFNEMPLVGCSVVVLALMADVTGP